MPVFKFKEFHMINQDAKNQSDKAQAKPMTEVEFQQLLISGEVLAKMLSISKRQIWRLRSAGKLPKPIHIGGSLRWRKAEIVAWIAEGAPDLHRWEAIKVAAKKPL
jgi:predicted DNA-binding transcriptional regulator AlpA